MPKFYVDSQPGKDEQHEVYDVSGERICSTHNDYDQAVTNIAVSLEIPEDTIEVTFENMCTFDDGKTFPAWFERPQNDDDLIDDPREFGWNSF